MVLQLDSNRFSLRVDEVEIRGLSYLAFHFDELEKICEVKLYPRRSANIQAVRLLPSADFVLIDSLVKVEDSYYQFKVRFTDLIRSDFLKFMLAVSTPVPPNNNGSQPEAREAVKVTNVEVRLFPYTNTKVQLVPPSNEIYIGEEKVYDLACNNPANLRLSGVWSEGLPIDYRVTNRNGQLRLHVIGRKLGAQELRVELSTYRPSLTQEGEPRYQLEPIRQVFAVKESRLAFLKLDQQEVILNDEAMRKGVEVQLDNHPNLKLNKTYRIENQEFPGGFLVGEIYTRNMLSNDKVLCWLRVFNYHRISDGYLYIKDGDEPKFISNFAIAHQTVIQSMSLMRNGQDWTSNLNVSPGEIVEVKVEGEGLERANLKFEGLFRIVSDSVTSNDGVRVFTLKIPLSIYRKKINLYLNGQPTGLALNVTEYQRAKSMEFVMVDYGEGPMPLTEFNAPVLYTETIKDIVFSFKDSLLDIEDRLYGKQPIRIEVKVTNSRRQLLDVRTIENIVVCPGETSIRFPYYDKDSCRKGSVSLNSYLNTKTHELEDWSRMEITVTNLNPGGTTHRFDVYAAKKSSFDIDISFPAGLLIKKLNSDEQVSSFGGVSLAVVAQFSFFRPGMIARQKPYKIGAGILAFNAFNLSSSANVNRDLALVTIGSVYPLQRGDRKLSFPLHAGVGYLVNDQKLFVLLGPGIRVSL